MNVPLRMCCVCRKMQPRTKLLRVIRTKDNIFEVIKGKQKLFGRSVYVCECSECLSQLNKKRTLNRAFRQEVPQRIYDELTKNS